MVYKQQCRPFNTMSVAENAHAVPAAPHILSSCKLYQHTSKPCCTACQSVNTCRVPPESLFSPPATIPTRVSILLQHHYRLSYRQPDTLPGFSPNKRQNAVFSFFLLLQHSYQLPFRHSTKSVLACACVCVSCLDSLTVAWPAVEKDLMTAYRTMNGSCESHMDS